MSFLQIIQSVSPCLQSKLNTNDEFSANAEAYLSAEMIAVLYARTRPVNATHFDKDSLDEHEWAMLN